MNKTTLSLVAVVALVGSLSAEDFSLLSHPKFTGEVRARYENVDDQSNTKSQANAYTVRATLGLDANLFGLDSLTMKAEGTTVQSIGTQRYFDGTYNGMTSYDTVKDPVQTRFDQAYLQYTVGKTAIKAGRQVINLDNQRFIGSVDWRQMMQSFDAVVVTDTTVDNLTLHGGYIHSIAGITNAPVTYSNSIVLNGSYKLNEMLKVTAYDYMLSSLHDTTGMALSGNVPLSIAKMGYRVEYARQGDASRESLGGIKNAQADAHYYNLDALANINGVLVGGGYEVLSGSTRSDGKTAFQTPLATLHAFNGWADKFLVTPIGGLCDTSATLGYTNPTLGKAVVVYHNFKTDQAMATKSDLGHEWDMLYTNAIPGVKGLSGLIKAGYYKAGDVATFTKDVSKVWLQLDYKF
jgi:hypothetical protein